MNRPRRAQLVKCVQERVIVPDMTAEEQAEHGRLFWVAYDTMYRRFAGTTQAEAEQMLHNFNNPPQFK